MAHFGTPKYNAQKSSEIRYNIEMALLELATFSGVDIKKIQTTPPYAMVLNNITSQKIAAELKKLVDMGIVVKEVARGKTVKYMLKSTYDELFKAGKIQTKQFGYCDYRDNQKAEILGDKEDDEDEDNVEMDEAVLKKLQLFNKKYEYMW